MYWLTELFTKLILKILRVFPPETSSKISLESLKIIHSLNIRLNKKVNHKRDKNIDLCGITFDHYLGLSAGIDKEGKYFNSLCSLGFSHIEIGTFTPLAQKGNDFPRVKRISDKKSLINRLGFNNPGILDAAQNVKRNKVNFSGVLGISIGKNKNTSLENSYKDYNYCLENCFHLADYVAVNISSPNTEGLRELSSSDYIEDLTSQINTKAKELEKNNLRRVPIFLKLSPDEDEKNLESIISISMSNNFSGFIISNTSKGTFEGITGGISGELLKTKSHNLLKKVYGYVGKEVPLIASGGISSKHDVEERLDSGAKLIQIYTSFIYEGPKIINELLN
jgi:dihydroorotate dehydrogenase